MHREILSQTNEQKKISGDKKIWDVLDIAQDLLDKEIRKRRLNYWLRFLQPFYMEPKPLGTSLG